MKRGKSLPCVLARVRRSIFPCLAVASNLMLETFRQRASALFFLLVAGTALVLPQLAIGGATLRNKLQVAVEYGLGLPLLLIAMATVVLAAGSLSRELSSRRIQTLATKPISRWRIVLGKLLGILCIDAVLVLTVIGIFGGSIVWIQSADKTSEEERELVRERFFTARVGVLPVLPPPDPRALDDFVKARASDPLTAGAKSREEMEAEARRALRMLRIEPGKRAELLFEGVAGNEGHQGEDLFVRYELQVSPPGGASQVESQWGVSGNDSPTVSERTSAGAPHELKLPASSIRTGGTLRLWVRNAEPEESDVTLLLDPTRVEVLSVYGRFLPNVFRGLLLVLAELLLLASLTAMGSALFTFPTANLLGFFACFTGLTSSFLRDAFAEVTSGPAKQSFTEWIGQQLGFLGSLLIKVLPDFTIIDPLSRLTEGRAVTADELLREAVGLFLEASALYLAAAWLFSRRELDNALERS